MTEPIRPGDNPNELLVFDHGFVRLDDAMATDLSVVNSARVSFAVRKEEMDDRDQGLIKFLMRDRHGCYDDSTDVLTDQGWKSWPEVTGEELFATRSSSGELEYQQALAVVHKEYSGAMVGFKGKSVDMMVTPDHNVLAAQTTTRSQRQNPTFGLRPAHSVLWRSHRHVATADWPGRRLSAVKLGGNLLPALPFMKLLGFFIGDGNLAKANGITFHIRKEREIRYLGKIVHEGRFELRMWGDSYAVPIRPSMRWPFEACYNADREKQIPRFLLQLEPEMLSALLEGLMHSDGSMMQRKFTERWSYSTTSRVLADQVQELALRVGRSATIRPQPRKVGDGHYGSKQVWRLTIYEKRNSRPGLCRTKAQADNHMGVETYSGNIHCVTVPNGTLYVRRNGYPVWSGNSPFEHNSFRFHIRTPIFVAREWFRHRIGSFNEESARYHKLADDFYVPDIEAVRSQVGKPGSYSFEPVEEGLALETRDTLQRIYKDLYAEYNALIDKGVAKELARSVLPFGIYTQFYWTINARAMMNFLSLRNSEFAQYEIRVYAEAVERFFAEKMPITHQCFIEFDRRAP